MVEYRPRVLYLLKHVERRGAVRPALHSRERGLQETVDMLRHHLSKVLARSVNEPCMEPM